MLMRRVLGDFGGPAKARRTDRTRLSRLELPHILGRYIEVYRPVRALTARGFRDLDKALVDGEASANGLLSSRYSCR